MKISKREFFDLWEGVKAQFFLDTNLQLKSKHYNLLAYKINKANGTTKGLVTETYLKNKVKVFHEITSTVSIRSNIYEALWNYASRNTNIEHKDNATDSQFKPSTNLKSFVSRIDRIESWIEESSLPETEVPQSELEQSAKAELREVEAITDELKLSDLIGTGTDTTKEQSITKDEAIPINLPEPIEALPKTEKESLILDDATDATQQMIPIETNPVVSDTSVVPVTEIVEPSVSKFQSKLLLFLSSIGIIFFLFIGYHLFSGDDTTESKKIPTYLATTSTPENTIETFFKHINQKDYKQAFTLTDNELWQPYNKFIKSDVWGGFEELSQPAMLAKDYPSKYGADKILEVSFYAFDIRKQENLFLKYDFHLAKRNGAFVIIRMVYPK